MNNYIYNNFKMYFPNEARRAVSYRELDTYAISIKTNDGRTLMYDDLDRSIRRLPDSNNLTEEEYRKEFSRRLRRLMFIRQITQADLSAMTGLTQPQISNYINGRNIPSFYIIDKIAKVLNCSTDDLRYTD